MNIQKIQGRTMQMLKNWNPEQIPEKEDIKVRLSAARTR